MILKQTRKLEICLALLILLSAGVIFLKFSFTNIINLGVISIYFLLWIENVLKPSNGILKFAHPNGKTILFVLFLFSIHFYLFFPFRGADDHFVFDFFWLIVFISTLFLEKKILDNAVKYFSNIIYWIALLALANYVISILGIQLPYIEFAATTRDTTYFIYPGTVRLYGQDYDLFGRTGFRLAGIFSEPSMFGILCGMVLYSESFSLERFKRTVIVIALILSFSTGAIIMSLGYLLFSIKNVKTKTIALVSIFVVVVSGIAFLPKEVKERFFENKLSGDIINNRISGSFDNYYSNYLESESAFYLFFGKGADVLSNNTFVASDYRGFLVKYGFIGILIMFLLILSFISKNGNRHSNMIVLFIFFVVFFHRSWLTILFVFLFFIYYLSFNNKKKFDHG